MYNINYEDSRPAVDRRGVICLLGYMLGYMLGHINLSKLRVSSLYLDLMTCAC